MRYLEIVLFAWFQNVLSRTTYAGTHTHTHPQLSKWLSKLIPFSVVVPRDHSDSQIYFIEYS